MIEMVNFMANMKEEILAAIKDQSLHALVVKELDMMEKTEGLDEKPILQKFYNIWKNSSGKVGKKNEINSWAAYALGLTEKKPDENSEFLPKRRAFARKGFPDIDSDFDYERRDEIYKYIIDTYGRENVGNIGTYGGLKMKSFIRRAVKAVDPENTFYKGHDEWKTATNALGDEIINSLPPQYGAFLKVEDEQGNEHAIKTVQDANKWCSKFAFYMEKYPALLEHSKHIEGLLSIFGCLSASTPILTADGWVRIDQLDGQKIAYLDSNKNIQYSEKYICKCTGVKKTYRMKLKNGNFIDVTDEHLIFTNQGVKKFIEIRENPKGFLLYSLNADPAARLTQQEI
jgi:hypothetical protein